MLAGMSSYIEMRARVGMTRRQVARLAMVSEDVVKALEDGAAIPPGRIPRDGSRLGVLLAVYQSLDDLWHLALAARTSAAVQVES